MPLRPDLSFSGLAEFVNEHIVSSYKKNNGAPIIEDWVSDSEEEDMPQAKIQKKTIKPSFAKIEFVKSKEQVKTPRKTTVKQGNQNKQSTHSPRGNQRNWNYMMSQRLWSNFEMINKACYVCGSFDHQQYDCNNHQRQFNNKKMVKPVWNYTQRVNHQNFSKMTHPNPKRNMIPKAVLMRSGLVSLTTARTVNTAQPRSTVNSARPMTNVFNKAHSTGNPQMDLQDQGVIHNGCSRHMTGNMSYLTNFKENDEGYVAFGDPKVKAEAVNTSCYVQNRVLVTKPHNKTPYELFLGRKPALGFMRPFRCPVTILNTIDHLGKFDGKADEGFFVGYSINSKAFRVFNSRTRIVEENLHVQFSKNTPNIAGSRPNWLFDIDALTKSMNYKPVIAGNQSNGNAGTKACDDAGKARMETIPGKDYILLPLWPADLSFS
ncbi:ribonuclease H-like domain-containing protein [Tanacetum coccineum]